MLKLNPSNEIAKLLDEVNPMDEVMEADAGEMIYFDRFQNAWMPIVGAK